MLKVLLTVAAIALVVWAIVRLLDQRQLRATGGGARPRPPRTPPRVTGPDDDPDFLRELERRRRREQRDGPDSPAPN